jgi:microcystin-dependent protein
MSSETNLPIGTILIYSLTSLPTGYLLCDGTSYSSSGTYNSLYKVIGTTYGTGSSSNTFKVPNFTSKFPIGKTSTQSLGQTGGVTSVSITKDNLPSHNHTINISFTHSHNIEYNNEITDKQYCADTLVNWQTSNNENAKSVFKGYQYDVTMTTGTQVDSQTNNISISTSELQNTGESISLDVTNSQMNLNYIIKYA